MDTITLFVYGTLRRHESNHGLLKKASCLAEQAWVNGELFDTGYGDPTLELNESGKVYGELYLVSKDLLPQLDALEDYEEGRETNLYDRTMVTVHTDEGTKRALVYVNVDETSKGEKIIHGDWKLHRFMTNRPEQIYYFAYGSCMDDERFRKAGVDHCFKNLVGAAILKGYSMKYLFRISDGGRADIVEDGGVTEGLVYLTSYEGVEYLFTREGFYGGWYRPTFIDVDINGERVNDVLTFHVYNKMPELSPPDHYSTEILRGAKGRVSEQYYQFLLMELDRLKK
ncbi:gamma-glutamylcyclotransferase [Robertmurraya korlensis]|uniref:gamma-glutamylcyclotransferase n=1 Tax=Robertmurraya korlensis TaxID=519977 RepID=UPI0008245B9B|nr:gamma-glutamylcyclotransferase family protein [Robertmurraya korlensis]